MSIANSLYNTPAFSIAALIKTPAVLDTNNDGYIFNAPNTMDTGGGYDLYTDYNLSVTPGTKLFVVDAGQNNIASDTNDANLTPDTWYRVVAVWDSSLSGSDVLKIYVDGVNHTFNFFPSGFGNSMNEFLASFGYNQNHGTTHSMVSHRAEFIYANAAFSQTDITNLDNYWVSKWAV